MNKTILAAFILTVSSSVAFADPAVANSTQSESSAPTQQNTETASQESSDTADKTIATQGADKDKKSEMQNNTASAPNDTTAEVASVAIDCTMKIPSDQKEIDQKTIQQWSEKAALQAFTMQASSIDAQLASLEKCFTKSGWEGYKTALDKSGNIDAIKTEDLVVSADLSGTPSVVINEENKQWNVIVPLKVVYKNAKNSITQDLNVTLLVSRDNSDKLGIMQVVAAPQEAQSPKNDSSNSSETTPPSDDATATSQASS